MDPWFETSIAALCDGPPDRVWSVIVSLFGDLAQDPQAQISGSALTRIVEPMGIKPEATRVALHRLRKDGWLISQRVGRISHHALTDFGRAQSGDVTPRIYARDLKIREDWQILIGDPNDPEPLQELLLSEACIPLGSGVALRAVDAETGDFLAIPAQDAVIPPWVQNTLCPAELNATYKALHAALQTISQNVQQADVYQTATLRTLIVHYWRRVLLRHVDVPTRFFPPDWPGLACRALVCDLLDALPRPTIAELEAS